MQARRPPCWSDMKRHLILLILSAGFIFNLPGEDFVLPDLILSKVNRPLVALPVDYPDSAENWDPSLPDYRRLYPLLQRTSSAPFAAADLPVEFGTIVPIAGPVQITHKNDIPAQFFRMTAGTEINIREGVDLSYGMAITESSVLTAVVSAPFNSSSPRPLAGEISWSRIGRFTGDLRLGLKDDGMAVPYSSGHLSWNGGLLSPDAYFLDYYVFGNSYPGAAMSAGTEIDLPVGESEWSFIGELEGGGWYSQSNSSGFVRTAVAAGYTWPVSRLSLDAGADIAFSGSTGLTAAPYLQIQWFPVPDVSIFADSRLNTKYPESLDSVFRREDLAGFIPEVPINTRFRAGFIRNIGRGFFYKLVLSYSYGLFSTAIDGYIRSVDDKRLSGNAGFGYEEGFHEVNFTGSWDVSTEGNTFLWDTELEYSFRALGFYISGGTEDTVLGGYFPGIRGERPIIGTGVNWTPGEDWEIDVFTYTEIPWNNPSLRFSLDWRNK